MPEDLSFVNASTETIRGVVSTSWKKSVNGFEMNVEIPFNCSAMIHVPSVEGTNISENGIPIEENSDVEFVSNEVGYSVLKVSSGKYYFSY